jgi:hypothetical protein
MSPDDLLAYLAAKPKKEKPTLAKSDKSMLKAWIYLRNNKYFINDVLCRHGLSSCYQIDEIEHEHAIANAWSHISDYLANI